MINDEINILNEILIPNHYGNVDVFFIVYNVFALRFTTICKTMIRFHDKHSSVCKFCGFY